MTKTVRKLSVATRLRDLVVGDSGFTLLETLAVMVIIGLLAAITVPQMAKWREKAYITSLKTDARNVANAIEASYVDNERYPTGTEVNAIVASDVKLNPGNTVTNYGYSDVNNWFAFAVRSNKTDNLVTYFNNRSPTIVILSQL